MKNPPEKYQRAAAHFLGYAYTHDISLWYSEEAIDSLYAPLWTKQAQFMGKWDGNVEFIPYWRKNNPFTVKSNNKDRVFMSAYRRNDKVMLIVMNDTNKDQAVEIKLNPQTLLGKKTVTYIEDGNGKKFPPANLIKTVVPRQIYKVFFVK